MLVHSLVPRLLCGGGGSHESLGTRLACLKRAASAFAYAYKPDPSAAPIASNTRIQYAISAPWKWKGPGLRD